MSLQLIAKQMEAKGRNGDSVLVHMTTGEVAGLQKLAETAGGSLSVNPETGLVEANFLKQMLPTLVGAGVGFFTANPMLGAAAGAAVGGYQANRAGQDVGSGMLMGGLGGYGGASLGSSLQAAGAPAVAGAPTATDAATKMATNAAVNALAGGGPQAAPAPAPFLTTAQQDMAAGSYGFGGDAPRLTTAGTGANASGLAVNPNTQAPGNVPAGAPTKFADMTYSQRLDQGLGGIKAFGTEEGRDKALKSLGGSEGVMRMLMMAGLPAMYGARTSVPHPFPLLSADVNKRGFADGGEVGFFTGGGTGQGNGLLSSLMGNSAYENRKYIIDPATGNVIRNPNLPPPAAATFANMVGSDSGGGGGGIAPTPGFTTPEEQRAFYAENPAMGRFTRALQDFNPFASLQERVDPGSTVRQADIALSGVPNAGIVSGGLQDPQQRAEIARQAAESVSETGGGSNDGNVGDGGSTEGGRGVDGTATGGMGESTARAQGGSLYLASGGLAALARGGMRSGGFVIPADVVSMVGEGNTDAGYKRIKSMVPSATAIKGKDGGQADTVKTSIEGKQPARVAHGEMYIPPETVKSLGGAKKLYAMMDRVRQQATGSKKQIKPVSLKRAMA